MKINKEWHYFIKLILSALCSGLLVASMISWFYVPETETSKYYIPAFAICFMIKSIYEIITE